jgi:competence protein ComGC
MLILTIITILNTLFVPYFSKKQELPVDTSQDILTEGISDPSWIAKPE